MNTILFLCGAGCGSLITTLLLLQWIAFAFRTKNAAQEKQNKQHDDLMECHLTRNETFDRMLSLFEHVAEKSGLK